MISRLPTAQRSLFDDVADIAAPSESLNLVSIPGLTYVPDFIDEVTHSRLLAAIDSHEWLADLKRRVQHYGYKYDYKSRFIDYSMRIGPLPLWASEIADRLYTEGFTQERPDQVIVNEYLPGQGIASHIDCEPCFSETIISMSLGSSCLMDFTHKTTRDSFPIVLEPRSLVVLQAEARHDWQHGIAARKTDKGNGRVIHRSRRVSLTFRKVIIGEF